MRHYHVISPVALPLETERMSLVTGEDSESDEEINTEQISGQSSRASNLGGSSRSGIVAGEDDEEGDEEDG